MNITLDIPDSAAAVLTASAGPDPARALLEAYALESYRNQVLGESAVRRLLGFETRLEVHAFLKEHGVFMHYTMEDLERDTAVALDVARRHRAQLDEATTRDSRP
jgi:hypothetical protein